MYLTHTLIRPLTGKPNIIRATNSFTKIRKAKHRSSKRHCEPSDYSHNGADLFASFSHRNPNTPTRTDDRSRRPSTPLRKAQPPIPQAPPRKGRPPRHYSHDRAKTRIPSPKAQPFGRIEQKLPSRNSIRPRTPQEFSNSRNRYPRKRKSGSPHPRRRQSLPRAQTRLPIQHARLHTTAIPTRIHFGRRSQHHHRHARSRERQSANESLRRSRQTAGAEHRQGAGAGGRAERATDG